LAVVRVILPRTTDPGHLGSIRNLVGVGEGMRVSSGFPLRSVVILGGFAVLGSAGCQKKDPEACNQAQQVTRQALTIEDFASARTWREYAYKQCDDTAVLVGLDKEIVDREAAVLAKKAADAKRAAETQQLLKLFLDFVAQNRAAPERASAAPVCDPPADAASKPGEESKERFCAAVRQAGAHTLEARYYDADRTAFRFTTTLPDAIECKTLSGTVSKAWDVPAVGGKTVKRWRCDLTGPLAGLTAVVSGAPKAPLYVVSPTYVDRDPGWRTILVGP
jgi:hypothetical protein